MPDVMWSYGPQLAYTRRRRAVRRIVRAVDDLLVRSATVRRRRMWKAAG